MKKIVYKVFHVWPFLEYVTEFSSMEKAVAFIEKQEDPDCWCIEKIKN